MADSPLQQFARSDPALVALLERHLTSFESLETNSNINSVAIFLTRVDTFNQHKYFTSITDWTESHPIVDEEALHIRTEMFDKLPESELSIFINDAR